MYPQARIYIKTALVQLVVSVLLGALLLVNAGLPLHRYVGLLLPVYYHLLMVGWATQLIAGVALWMFPPYSRERPRGDERLGWLAYGALNGGLLVRAVAEPLQLIRPTVWTSGGLVLSAIFQVSAIWLLVFALWPRVKGRSGPHQSARGAP
jgi:hypothetical protein